MIENWVWVGLKPGGEHASVYSSWYEWIPRSLLAQCDILSLTDNNRHLIVFRNYNWLINNCYALGSFKTFYFFNPFLFVFFIVLFIILNIIIFWRMSRRFFSWANNEAWNLQISLYLIGLFRVKTANPSLIELMIQSSMQSW